MMTLAQLETEIFALPIQQRASLAQRLLLNIEKEDSNSDTMQKAEQLQILIAQGDADIKAGRITEFANAKSLANRIRENM